MHSFLLAVIAGCGFAVSSLLGVFGVTVNRVVRLASVAIAAGILLAITVSDLLPDALEDAGRTRTAFGFMCGFLLLFLMEALSGAHVHHHDMDDEHLHHGGHGHAHSHADAPDDVPMAAHHSVRPFVIGLALHNLADGLVIGATTMLSAGSAAAVTSGVFVHQLPVGISFAAVLASLQTTRRNIVRASLLCAAMIPLGVLAVMALPDLSDVVLGTLVAGAGGALCYLACGHLLPEAQSERHAVVAPVFVVAILATTTWFTLVSTG